MSRKYKQSEPNPDNVFQASADQPETGDKLFNVTFRENRTFEVRVRRETIRFEGGRMNPVFPEKYRDGVPESVLNTDEFQSQIKFFNITERK